MASDLWRVGAQPPHLTRPRSRIDIDLPRPCSVLRARTLVAMVERGLVFGVDAEGYDTYRPSYPDDVISMIVDGCRFAVDVGCGTGIAARMVRNRGVDVVGVEPDSRMAAVAASHGIEVVVTPLETWSPVTCDVMYSAEAWHWVDPIMGAAVAAASVTPGGKWMAFWNDVIDEPLAAARADVYRRAAPHLLSELASSHLNGDEFFSSISDSLIGTGAFAAPVRREFRWTEQIGMDALVRRLAASSAHQLLDTNKQDELASLLTSTLGGSRSTCTLLYRTVVLVAEREPA